MAGEKKAREIKYIQKQKARIAALEKRKISLRKKAYELSTLCDVPVCYIMYPENSNSPLLMYPEDKSKVRSLIDRYISITRDEKSSKRKLDLDHVVQAKRRKVGDSADFQNEASTSGLNLSLIPNLDGLSIDQLYNMRSVLDEKLQFVRERIVGFESYSNGGFDEGFGFMDPQFGSNGGFDQGFGFMDPQFGSNGGFDLGFGFMDPQFGSNGGFDQGFGFMDPQFASNDGFDQGFGFMDPQFGKSNF